MGVSNNPKISDQDTAIAKIYDTLVKDLGAGQAATRGIFDRGQASMAGAYQGAADQLRGAQGGMAARLSSSLGGLGLGAALPSVMQPVNEQFAFDQGQIARERGTDLGSLSKQGTQYQAIGQTGINNAQKEKAQTRVSAMERLQAVLADLEAERIQAEAAQRQQELENALELKKIQAANAAASGGSSDPLLDLKAQKMGLEIQGMEQDLLNPNQKPVEYASGQRGLHEFLNSPSAYWSKAADPGTQARINNILNSTANRMGQTSYSSGGRTYFTDNMTPLDIAMTGVANTKEHSINKEALRMALQLYYG